MIIGICGLISSGKDTIASRLIGEHLYERYSWATPLKDITSSLFGWDREMLEGSTPYARTEREQRDDWWSKNLGFDWSPRYALQYMGTEVMRNSLHKDIWILAGMKRIAGKENVVIPDTRFPNEVAAIRKLGGQIWNVQRGSDPEWSIELSKWKQEVPGHTDDDVVTFMTNRYPAVHASEYSWHEVGFDCVIKNDGSIEDLYKQVDLEIRNRA